VSFGEYAPKLPKVNTKLRFLGFDVLA